MTNVLHKRCRENQGLHCTFNNLSPENREKMRKSMVEPYRSQMKIWRLCTACWIPKATNTLSEPLFPLQQRLPERASILRYTYSVCLA